MAAGLRADAIRYKDVPVRSALGHGVLLDGHAGGSSLELTAVPDESWMCRYEDSGVAVGEIKSSIISYIFIIANSSPSVNNLFAFYSGE